MNKLRSLMPSSNWGRERPCPLIFPAPSAHQIDHEADQENQAKPSATDGRAAKVKTAAAEQKQKNNNEEE